MLIINGVVVDTAAAGGEWGECGTAEKLHGDAGPARGTHEQVILKISID